LVEDHAIGHLEGFRFVVDPEAGHADRRLLLAAAEKHLPELLAARAQRLVQEDLAELAVEGGEVRAGGRAIARLEPGNGAARPRLVLSRELAALGSTERARL